MRRSFTLIATLSVALLLTAAGCDSSEPASEGQPGSSEAPAQPPTTNVVESEVTSAGDPTLGCSNVDELDEIVLLLKTGQPTYDFEPAADLEELTEWADLSIQGVMNAAVRTSENSYTVLSVSDVVVLAGSGDVDQFALSSLWASGQGPDPLAETVGFDGLRFVAFLGADPTAPGGWQPYVQGLVVACDTGDPLVRAVAETPPNVDGLSLDEIAEAVSAFGD